MRACLTLLLGAALLLGGALLAPDGAALAQEGRKKQQEALAAEILPLVDAAAQGAAPEALEALASAALLRHGSLAPLLQHLEAVGAAFPERRLRALLLARDGDLREAESLLAELAAAPPGDADPALWRALAAARDMLGDRDEALSAYSRLLDLSPDAEERGRAELCMALLRTGKAGGGGEPPLLALARAAGGEWPERVLPLLAVTGEFAAAAGLERAGECAAEDFIESVRRASWALAGGDLPDTRAHAERALAAARLPRDRRYALALLVEAYRAGDALAELCARFAAAPDLSAEAREVWIDLLRELGQAEQAMRLFETSADGRFTPEMRRELLELCREAGDGEVLVQSFQRLIAAEPAVLEWREGLARFLLERGDAQAAEAVWLDLLESWREDPGGLMRSAAALASLGQNALAERFARQASAAGGAAAAALFLSDLHHRLGQAEEARAALDVLRDALPAADPERVRLAEAYERIGRQADAIQVLEVFRQERRAEDVDMRLAWLYSQVGRDADALRLWREIWEGAASLPRQRYAEDRLLNVAARTGTLADIAVDLEEKVAAGAATPRERGLLVNLYTQADDPVSAAEVLAEHARQSGGESASLEETARVYLTCSDFKNYEKTLRQLLAAHPAGREDYLTQLAMSALERARPEEAKKILEELKEAQGQEGGEHDEFAAGVLALAGLRDEAIAAYRRALVLHPDRIEAWLLLGGSLAQEGEDKPRAVGLFQQLAAAADKDDLFTVAIDGLLNVDAERRALEWASRAVLERIALHPDKTYLYQLLADVAEALDDPDLLLRALEEALPAAGERRLALLRELMELAAENGRDEQSLRYGRRALLLGEHAPPEVYVTLGEQLLKRGEARAAAQTFSRAQDVPDQNAFQRRVARSFEEQGYAAEALRQYEGLLALESADVELLAKVAELDEALGRDEAAHELYARALDLMFARRPVVAAKETTGVEEVRRGRASGRNVDAYEQHFERVLAGFLATLAPDAPAGEVLLRAAEPLAADLAEARAERAAGASARALADFPKTAARAAFLRRLACVCRAPERANVVDLELLAAFDQDRELLATLVEERLEWGFEAAARDLVERCARPEDEKERARRLLSSGPAAGGAGQLRQRDVLRRLLGLIAQGRVETGRRALQQIGFEPLAEADLEVLPVLTAYAAHIQDAESSLLLVRRWISAAARFEMGYLARLEAERACTLVWPVLDAAERRSLANDLVKLLLKEPGKRAAIASLLALLQQALGERLITLEQAKEAIAAVDAKRFYAVSGLLELCPTPERLELVRAIWQDVPGDDRALFILDLVGSLEEEAPAEFRDFIKERFAASLGELEDGLRFYAIENNLLGREHNLDLAADLLAAAYEQDSRSIEVLAGYALCLAQAGRVAAARSLEDEAFARIVDQGEVVWQTREALRALLASRDSYADLLARIDEREGKRGVTVPSVFARSEILLRAESDPRRSGDCLRAALESLPNEVELLMRLRNVLEETGSEFERLRVDERLLEQDPDDDWRRSMLVRAWRQAQNPVRAERCAQRGPRPDGGSRELATPEAIREALDRGDLEEARRTTRRMWRGLDDDEYSGYGWQRQLTQPWTEDRAEQHRTGLPDLGPSGREKLEEEQPRVCDALADLPFGEDELRRALACLEPRLFERAGMLVDAIARAAARRLGAAAAVEEVLELMRQGRAARTDRALLLSLLTLGEEASLPNAGETAADLLSAVSPRERAQVTRLARLFARLGQPEEAARLFLWAAVLVDLGEGDGGFSFGRLSAESLLEEVREALDGELMVATSAAIIERGRPALVPAGPGPLDGLDDAALDDYGARLLGAWKKLAAPAEALERNRRLCDALLEERKSPPRRAALSAAELYFHAGEWENGLRALEIALCGRGDEVARSRPEQLASLLPEPGAAPEPAAAGYESVMQALESWLAAKRLSRRLAAELLCIVAVRLGQAGHASRGLEVLARAHDLAAPWAATCLWVSDAAHLLGDEDLAFRVERGLLEEMRLDVERIPATVRALAQREGNEAAIALGERAAEFTLHPDLLEFLIETAEHLGRNDRASHWRAVRDQAAAIDSPDQPLHPASHPRSP